MHTIMYNNVKGVLYGTGNNERIIKMEKIKI